MESQKATDRVVWRRVTSQTRVHDKGEDFRLGHPHHDELDAGRAIPAPTICPSLRCRRTATSCPAGFGTCRRTGLPDQAPSTDIERTMFASVSVRPPFSPRPTAV